MNGKTKNIIRLIVIIIMAVIIIFAVKIINKNNEMTKMKEAKDNTEIVIKAAKKKYQEENKDNNNWIDVDATKLDVKNKPESGTYTVVNRDNKILVTATNLKFDKYYCQYDGEKATCSKKAVKVENEELPSTGENYEEDDDVDSGEVVPDDDKDDLFNGQIKDDDVIIDEIPGGVQNFPKN